MIAVLDYYKMDRIVRLGGRRPPDGFQVGKLSVPARSEGEWGRHQRGRIAPAVIDDPSSLSDTESNDGDCTGVMPWTPATSGE